MTANNLKIAGELKRKLSKEVHLIDLRIFGSRARGDEDEYSDMDVFVEVGTLNKRQREKMLDIIWDIGFENGIVISPLIFTKDELENSPLRSSPIVKNIRAEGVQI